MMATHETATMRMRRYIINCEGILVLKSSLLNIVRQSQLQLRACIPEFFKEMKKRCLRFYIKKFIKCRKAITIQIHRATDPEIREISDLCDLPGLCLTGDGKKKKEKKKEKKRKNPEKPVEERPVPEEFLVFEGIGRTLRFSMRDSEESFRTRTCHAQLNLS